MNIFFILVKVNNKGGYMKKILIGLLFTFFMITNVNAEVEVKLKNDEFGVQMGVHYFI